MGTKLCSKCNIQKLRNEFFKETRTVDGLNRWCKDCKNTANKGYYNADKEKILNRNRNARLANPQWAKKSSRNQRLKEGHGVYVVTYLSGIYIGSGQLAGRRNQHMLGNTVIGKSIKEKANNFKVLLKCADRDCKWYEQRAIDTYGLGNLLNTRRSTHNG